MEKLQEESSKQTPVLWVFERTAKIYIAYNFRKDRIDELRYQAIEAERRSDWRKAVEIYSELTKFENENQEIISKLEFAKEQFNLKVLYDKAQKYLSDGKLLLAYQTFEHIIEIKSDFKDVAKLLSGLKIQIEQKIEKLQEQITLFREENNFEAEEKFLIELKELSPENKSLDSRLIEIQQQLKIAKSIK